MEPSVNWNKQTNRKGEAKAFGEGLEFGREIRLTKGAANGKTWGQRKWERGCVNQFCNPLK